MHICTHRIQCHVYQMSLVKCSLSPGELQDTDMPLYILHYHHEHSVPPDCRFWAQKGRCLAPEAPLINDLNKVDERARIKTSTAQSLSLYSPALPAEQNWASARSQQS